MVYIVILCVAVSVGFAFMFLFELVPGRSALVDQRLIELQASGGSTPAALQRRKRQEQTEKLKAILQAFGESMEERSSNTGKVREQLIRAGFPHPSAVPFFLATRVLAPAALGGGALLLLPAIGTSSLTTLLVLFYFEGM